VDGINSEQLATKTVHSVRYLISYRKQLVLNSCENTHFNIKKSKNDENYITCGNFHQRSSDNTMIWTMLCYCSTTVKEIWFVLNISAMTEDGNYISRTNYPIMKS